MNGRRDVFVFTKIKDDLKRFNKILGPLEQNHNLFFILGKCFVIYSESIDRNYIYKGLYPTVILYVVYTGMAVYGYVEWQKSMKKKLADDRGA